MIECFFNILMDDKYIVHVYIYNYLISNYVSFIYLKVYIYIYMYTLPPYPPIHLPATFTKTSLGVHRWIGLFQQSRHSLGLCCGHYCSHGAPGWNLGMEWAGWAWCYGWLEPPKMVWELFLLESMQISTCTFPIIESLCFLCVHIHPPLHTYTHVFAYLLHKIYISNLLLEDTYTFHIFL